MGGEVLHNTGQANVTIDKITLADPSGLALIESVVVPIATNAVGYTSTYPPSGDFLKRVLERPGLDWAHRTPAVGATVAPGPAPGNTNLVTGIRVTGGSGSSASGLLIDYHVKDGKSYRVSTPVSLVVKVAPDKCT